ncbi:hypothetical protein BpHYR1_023688 [Brachionus plicatilis]|uniref:Uncharacterized protein n=1 Tax=Brachionus plicatilis TaxID=10195 RepID=A0A3M7PLG1_BRAPC|nr:hypothetical protein BpHYR1_023688 [Brachionus plicatilis]
MLNEFPTTPTVMIIERSIVLSWLVGYLSSSSSKSELLWFELKSKGNMNHQRIKISNLFFLIPRGLDLKFEMTKND